MSQRVFVRNLGGTPIVIDAATDDGQISFPATQNPSSDPNTLDDYEEGTWVPALTFTTPGDLSVVYSTQVGRYTKVGRLVVAEMYINTSTFTYTGAASGNLLITGLPFTPFREIEDNLTLFGGFTKAGYTQFGIQASTTTGGVFGSGSGVTPDFVTSTNTTSGTNLRLSATLVYSV